MRGKFLALCALLLAAAVLCAGCAPKETVEAPELLEPVGVQLDSAVAYIGDLSEITTYDAVVVPAVEELYMTVAGRVKKLYVTLGDEVKAGDVLLELDESDTREQAEALERAIEYQEQDNRLTNRMAEIDIEMLEAELRALIARRAETNPPADLEQQIALKQLDIEEARLRLTQTQEAQTLALDTQRKELAELNDKLGKNLLIAPFDGRISHALTLHEGDWLSAYTTVAYLADDTKLSLRGSPITSSKLSGAGELYALIAGKRYEITNVPLSQEEFIAIVVAGGQVPTLFTIDGPQEDMADLHAGMYAAVCLVSKQAHDVLLLPTNALFRDATGRYVYVLDEHDGRERRQVKTGLTTGWLTQITEGLEEGERVYVKD